MTLSHNSRWAPGDAELSRALEHQEFEVYYQPIVHLPSSRVAGAEALVRWRHPEHGLLSPGSFIERAEASGFSVPLGEWVHRTVCRQAQAWQLAKLDLPIVGINVSNAQVTPGYLGRHLHSILEETGLDVQRLAVEIHEESMPDRAVAQTILTELASVGVQLWSDDFGTGPSSLPYLAQFPFTVLKIDRSFVWTMTDNPHWARTVTGVIGLAHHLDLQVIAEGVTTAAQIELLRAHDCDMIQGGYFSPPVPVELMTALLEAGGHIALNNGYID